MRKSTILILIGVFIVVTCLLGVTKHDGMYEKKKQFNSSEEVIEQLVSNPMKAIRNDGRIRETDEYLECLSQRKRLTETNEHYSKIEKKQAVKLDEKTKNSILDTYNNLRNNFSKRRAITSEDVVRLKVVMYSLDHVENGEMVYSSNQKTTYMDFVLVDEGEGFVIDYVNEFDENHIIEDDKNA